MKKKITNHLLPILSIIFLFSSCFLGDIGADPDIIFKTYWTDDISNRDVKHITTVNNDTLLFKKIKYVITDLKLINDKRVIKLDKSRIVNGWDYITFDSGYGGIYQISFNLGIEDINQDYNQLKAQNFDIEDGYYFLKMAFQNKTKDSIYNYNIAKKDSSSKISSFKVTIDGFNLSGGLFVNQAIIGVNLKNLFTKPNLINIDSLTTGSINNQELQLKMIENAKNMFFLDQFVYD